MIYSNGDAYVGEWKNDKFNGSGIYYHNDGVKYEGNWIDDEKVSKFNFLFCKDGDGVESWPDGSYFQGKYSRGLKEGRGTFTWSDHSCYIGDFVNNMMQG